ncbi:MAG: O-methyltransferase [Bacteroidia bacterium]|jgi:caffeoyl-CoA O-methyltransferase|nr:O-methyltransferase [Bacteroidia bacterium]
MYNIVKDEIQQYCDNHSGEEPEVLKQLTRYTFANVLQPRMLSGHFQGRVLSFISKLVQPQFILEIGTYTGYSALCLAEGLKPDGKLITIDINPEQEEHIYQVVKQAGFENKIQFIVGDAANIIPTLPHAFDLIFIDADKPNYDKYYELAIKHSSAGAIIILDNVLWSGKVIDELSLQKDKDTILLDKLNKKIKSDPRVEPLLLPIRDGLMVTKKK